MIAAEDRLRLSSARAALARHGLSGCTATPEGARGEVLVLRPAGELEEALLQGPGADRLLSELRELGFSYLALDLMPREER